jgi:hypothetical protein
MTINDLRIDIIAAVSQLTDVSTLEKIRAEITDSQENATSEKSPWRGAETELRTGVSFDDLMQEQRYRPVSYREFTDDPLKEKWKVSLDDLLALSKSAA